MRVTFNALKQTRRPDHFGRTEASLSGRGVLTRAPGDTLVNFRWCETDYHVPKYILTSIVA